MSGRGRTRTRPPPRTCPTARSLTRLNDALTLVSRHTGVPFSVYLGEFGGQGRPAAERLHDDLGSAAVLIAVDPGRREVAIVTGSEVKIRLSDRTCHLVVMSMTASFSEGDLLSGMRMLADQAGQPH